MNGGADTAWADTDWKDSSSPTSGFSYASYKLTSSCSGTIKLFTRAHFFELSTNTWWTSG